MKILSLSLWISWDDQFFSSSIYLPYEIVLKATRMKIPTVFPNDNSLHWYTICTHFPPKNGRSEPQRKHNLTHSDLDMIKNKSIQWKTEAQAEARVKQFQPTIFYLCKFWVLRPFKNRERPGEGVKASFH